MATLREILETLLADDEDITARAVARLHPSINAASSITRSESRRKLLAEYQQRQTEYRRMSVLHHGGPGKPARRKAHDFRTSGLGPGSRRGHFRSADRLSGPAEDSRDDIERYHPVKALTGLRGVNLLPQFPFCAGRIVDYTALRIKDHGCP